MRNAFVLALLVLCPTVASAGGLFELGGKPIGDYTIDLEGRYWFGGRLAGDVTADTKSIDGTTISLPNTLNLEVPSRPIIEGVLRLRIDKLQIRGAYFQAAFEDDFAIDESVTYFGQKFSFGTEVKTAATVHVGALDAEILFLNEGKANSVAVRVGAGIGGRYLGFRGKISESFGGRAENAVENGLFPVAAAFVSVAFVNLISIDAEIAGMALPTSFPRIHGKFLDASLEARFYLHEEIYLCFGYRFALLDMEYEGGAGYDVHARLKGFFVGLGLSF